MTTSLEIIERFEEAVREHAWIGSKHPSDFAEIEKEYKDSKDALIALKDTSDPDIVAIAERFAKVFESNTESLKIIAKTLQRISNPVFMIDLDKEG